MVPFDDKSPFVTSGIRIGTAAITTRGLSTNDMTQIVGYIDEVIMNHTDDKKLSQIAADINGWMRDFPLFKA